MTIDHTIRAFDEELQDLTGQVSAMGRIAAALVEKSVNALIENDKTLADDVVKADLQLDAMQRTAETAAVQIIARRQPVANDLRRIVGAMRMVSNLERVGDLAKNIAKRAAIMDASLNRGVVSAGFSTLAEAAKSQLAGALDAFQNNDAETACQIRLQDEHIDVLYNGLFRELLTYMMEDQRSITLCAHLLFCAKNLERIGDHATNLAETVEYIVTGDDVSADRPRVDTVVAME